MITIKIISWEREMTHSYWYETSAPKKNYSCIILGGRESMEMNPGAHFPSQQGARTGTSWSPKAFWRWRRRSESRIGKMTAGHGFLRWKINIGQRRVTEVVPGPGASWWCGHPLAAPGGPPLVVLLAPGIFSKKRTL